MSSIFSYWYFLRLFSPTKLRSKVFLLLFQMLLFLVLLVFLLLMMVGLGGIVWVPLLVLVVPVPLTTGVQCKLWLKLFRLVQGGLLMMTVVLASIVVIVVGLTVVVVILLC